MSNGTNIYLEGVTRPQGLQPCPFCGREPGYLARVSEHTGSGEFHALMCYCGGFSATVHQHADNQAETVALWNGRAPAAASGAAPQPDERDAEIERLRDELRLARSFRADVNRLEHEAETAECVAMALDKAGVPKDDGNGNTYSLWGRVQRFAALSGAAAPAAAPEPFGYIDPRTLESMSRLSPRGYVMPVIMRSAFDDCTVPVYAGPAPAAAQPAQQPLSEAAILELIKAAPKPDFTREGWVTRTRIEWARAIEQAHGIGAAPGTGTGTGEA